MIEYPDDNKVVESFARIRHDPDFVRIMEWLAEAKLDLARGAMIMDPNQVARNQGGYMALDDILTTAKEAAAVINAAYERKKLPKTRIP